MRVLSLAPQAEDLQPLGLKKFELRRLGSVVVLAGPNGGGKSRILSLLREIAKEGARGDPPSEVRRKLQSAENTVEDYRGRLASADMKGRIEFEKAIALYEQEALNYKVLLTTMHRIAWTPDVQPLRIIEFLPKSLSLEDPAETSKRQLRERHDLARDAAKRDAVNKLGSEALAYVQREQDAAWDSSHQNFQGPVETKNQAEQSYKRLVELINKLLGCRLSRSSDGDAMLYDYTIGKVPLSEGQKVLLQLAVAIHPITEDDDFVLVLDEPENHLHPEALVSLFDQVVSALPNAQLWVATHSVPLIAHLYAKDPTCLHLVKDGGVQHVARDPTQVLCGLLGDEAERTKLLRFIDLPHQLAVSQFAAECLLPPLVANHSYKDPQVRQVHEIVRTLKAGKSRLKLLDFGAGKGRLLAGMVDHSEGVIDVLDYVAYDPSATDRDICKGQIEDIYRSSEKRWYSKIDELIADHGERSFDVIVMCNVLHEISPEDWLTIFGSTGAVHRLGKPRGVLVLVEDLRIPVGERPNSSGFFLLDTLHLQRLFCAKTAKDRASIAVVSEREGRLKCHAVPLRLVGRATPRSRLDAIRELEATAIAELDRIRRLDHHDFRTGQSAALWSQLLASCYLYLRSAEGELRTPSRQKNK